MKKATQKSSPNHRDCDKDNKDQPNQPDTGRPQKKCGYLSSNLIFLNDALLFAFREHWVLTQVQHIPCSCPAKTHTVDIALAVKALRKRGYPIEDFPGDTVNGIRKRTYFLDLDGFYFSENGSAAND